MLFSGEIKKIIPVSILCLLAGCSPKQEQTGQAGQTEQAEQAGPDHWNLSVPELVKTKNEIRLSDIARSVEYIPLETVDRYLIGEKNVSVKPAGDYIFVSEHGKPVGVFDRKGKFIRTIGKIGKGPGEYNFDYVFRPDTSSQSVYVWNADQGTIMEFSFDNRYIRDIKPEVLFGAFAPLGNHRFFSWTFIQQEHNGRYYKLFFHDENGQIYHRVFEPQEDLSSGRGISILTPLINPTQNGFLFNSWKEEVIYRVEADSLFSPALTWDSGEFRFPGDQLSDDGQFRQKKENYVMDINGYETPTRWLLTYRYKGRLQLGLFEKTDGSCLTVSNPDTEAEGVINDLDGGPAFWPLWDVGNGNRFVRLIYAYQMIDCLKNPGLSPELRSQIEKMDENSNPVVMIAELR